MNTKTIPFTLERWKQGDCEVWTAGGEAGKDDLGKTWHSCGVEE